MEVEQKYRLIDNKKPQRDCSIFIEKEKGQEDHLLTKIIMCILSCWYEKM